MVLLSLYVLFAPTTGGTVELPGADKLVHAGLFLLLAATTRWRFGPAVPLLVAVAGYAALSEVVQATVLAGRSGDLLDLAADLAGAAAGWWAAGRWAGRD